ncbi:MAG: pyridoxal 5'-phosphate synthase glutaminase subunit PdxT [Candidatus Krumholzibacteriia bacterium]
MALQIGVLALQGDFQAHGHALERLGQSWREVRRACELRGLQGLVLPGGESTTMWHFMRENGLAAALRDYARAGGAVYGTCAGTILLAREVSNPPAAGLGILDITVERNSYGRQTKSSVRRAATDDPERPWIEAVLIRAPRILRIGPGVVVRARLDGDPVWVEQERAIATTFHPELGDDLRVHRRFLEIAASCPAFGFSRGIDAIR